MRKAKTFNKVDSAMVTNFVDVLPKWCPYCSAKCWRTDDYPFACRCSDCSSYFHADCFLCSDFDYNCCEGEHGIDDDLYLFELLDGRLVEVCKACACALYSDGLLKALPDFTRK